MQCTFGVLVNLQDCKNGIASIDRLTVDDIEELLYYIYIQCVSSCDLPCDRSIYLIVLIVLLFPLN